MPMRCGIPRLQKTQGWGSHHGKTLKMSRSAAFWLISLLLSCATGCRARHPGRIETAVAVRVKHVGFGGKKDVNPFPASAENIHAGQLVFSNYCFACHGLDGQNTGVPFAETMSPPVPKLNSPQVQEYTDGQIKWIIENGIFPSGMPASKGILREQEMWQIVTYIRHLPPAGSLGEPAAYSGSPGTP